jgi:hypothetical protein
VEVIPFPSEQFNTGGSAFHDNTVNPSRITATTAGRYVIAGRARVDNCNYSRLYVIKNGTDVIRIAIDPFGDGFQSGSVILDLAQNDYIELGTQSFCGVRSVEAQFEAALLVNGQQGPAGPEGPTGAQGIPGPAGNDGAPVGRDRRVRAAIRGPRAIPAQQAPLVQPGRRALPDPQALRPPPAPIRYLVSSTAFFPITRDWT